MRDPSRQAYLLSATHESRSPEIPVEKALHNQGRPSPPSSLCSTFSFLYPPRLLSAALSFIVLSSPQHSELSQTSNTELITHCIPTTAQDG